MLLKCLGFCRSEHTSASRRQRQYPTVIEELCHQFSLDDLRKSTNNFDENKILGRGDYCTVYKGCLQHNGATDYTVALKRMCEGTGPVCQQFKKEIELLCQLHHPNLMPLIGFCNNKDEKIIVYDYMPNGSFDDRLRQRNGDKIPLSWKKRLEICIGISSGVHYLHTGAKRTIIHRDIKPSNILLDSNMIPKLTYFSLYLQGPLFSSKPKLIKTEQVAGTIGFLAPENFSKPMPDLTDRSDVYSFGAFLLEVVCRESYTKILREMRELPSEELDMPIISDGARVPNIMQGLTVEQIIDPTIAGKIAPDCWEVFIDIIDRCLKHEPSERPAMGEVEVELEHALSLQQEADANNTSGEYSFLSTSITQPQQLQEEAPISA
ncbi:probable receptor-like protein kinase At5g38990 [Gastrolobium bilobum]|uniref:probable receptor-like protein kinase At5g38990 n=1 Tax=Gastrolobium bilobum TaxID=150636 RepID=UPI002AB1C88A|nr:probable receptor-like protein kinase At5g38990 [Gastrolobium bilobum]XP_061365907.1 probable receptor-like protein kinase At5g38990 [Gastrolobium bilobum]XP_061365908.1 probable receptor-like protein kinase At5g38990 [Gastrolobium bilobum]XP_061365909.1 probable receptor-like protein kinase At5g38990 [Gastrolobium bilobum]